MAEFGFVQYWRLRAVVGLFRTISSYKQAAAMTLPADSPSKMIQIPSRDEGRSIRARLYDPRLQTESTTESTTTSTDSSSPLPVLINWHGSGMVMENLDLDHLFCARVAKDNNMLVLDADYRKSPEHPFPSALHDVEDVLKWVESHPEQFDLDKVALSGASAGANLALAAASHLRDQVPKLHVRLPVAFYPSIDLYEPPEDKTVPEPVRPIPPKVLNIFFDSYLPDREKRKDPRVSPLFADPASFPDRVAIFTCNGDILAPEGVDMAKRLENGTRKVKLVELDKVGHGFDKEVLEEGSWEFEQREKMYSLAVEEIREALEL